LPDSVEQDHYLGKIADLIGVSKSALETKLTHGKQTEIAQPRRHHNTPAQTTRQAADHIKTQNHLLAIGLLRPDLRDSLQPLEADMLVDEPAQKLLAYLKKNAEATAEQISNHYSTGVSADSPLRPLGDYVKMLGVIFEELYQDLETLELRYEATRLKARLIIQYVSVQKQRLAEAMRQSHTSETGDLLAQARILDQLLHEATKEIVNAK